MGRRGGTREPVRREAVLAQIEITGYAFYGRTDLGESDD